MNLLLVEADELEDGRVWLEGRRAHHLVRVLGVAPGRSLHAGLVGGSLARATVLEVAPEGRVLLELVPGEQPPRPPLARVRLVLALPRPKALRRILGAVASLGLGRLDLVNAWRVERSFFSSPLLEPAAIRRELLLGCEQGRLTALPEVNVAPLLVPFLEALGAPPVGERRLLAEPAARGGLARGAVAGDGPLVCALGPEGGFVERELASLAELGFQPVRLATGVLRSEVAVSVLLGQLELLLR